VKPSTQLIVGLVFLIVAAGGIALVNREVIKPVTTPTPTERAKLLEGLFPVDITSISITDNKTSATFTAELGDDGNWKITKGDTTKDAGLGVDHGRLGNAVAVLPNMTPSTSFEATDLAPFGLDKPVYTLTLAVKGADLVLQIGAENPDKTDFYVMRSGSKQIFLIGNYNLQPFITFITEPPYAQPTEDFFAALTASPTLTPEPSATPSPTATAPATVEATATPY